MKAILPYTVKNNLGELLKKEQAKRVLEQNKRVLLAEIEANKNKIKQLEANIEEKNSKIIELENKDKELQIKYSNNNEELNKIRKKYEKINSVDKFNTTDIKGYFSKEYGN